MITILLVRSCFDTGSMDDANDGWYQHQCVELRSCLVSIVRNWPEYRDEDIIPELRDLRLRWLQFSAEEQFWIDEFTIISGLQDIEGEYTSCMKFVGVII